MTACYTIQSNGEMSTGVPMDLMSKMYSKAGSVGLKTLEDMADFSILVLEKWMVVDGVGDNKIIPLNKKHTAVLLRPESMLALENGNDLAWVGVSIANEVFLEKSAGEVLNKQNQSKEKFVLSGDTPEAKALTWLNTGRVGQSSLSMCATIFPNLEHPKLTEIKDRGLTYPHDPADLNRCLMFLEAVPSAKEHVGKMADIHPVWDGYVANWDKLVSTFKEEKAAGDSAPKTYELMKEYRAAAEQSKKPKMG